MGSAQSGAALKAAFALVAGQPDFKEVGELLGSLGAGELP